MILVTGVTSAVGKAVVQELLARKLPVRAFVRKPVEAEKLTAQGAEAFLGDMTERKSVYKALQGIESIYLIAPVAEHQLVTEMLWIEEAKKAGIRHLVKQSEIGADPQSASPLLKYHGIAEETLRTSGIPYTILRTLYFMQNFQAMYAHSIVTRGIIYASFADARISYIDARDVGAVAAHLLTEEKYHSQEYEATGPEALTSAHLAEIFSTVLGASVRYSNLSDEEAQPALLKMYPAWTAHAVGTLLQFYRQGGGDFVTQTIENVTGRKPRTIIAYITEHLQNFKAD